MKIRLSSVDDLKQVLYILNTVTLYLIEKGNNQWEYPWDEERIINQIKNNFFYVLLANDEIIGVFCIYEIDNINDLPVDEISFHINHAGMNYAVKLYKEGNMTVNQICEITSVSRAALYRKLAAEKNKPYPLV